MASSDLLPTRSAVAFLGASKVTLLKYVKLGKVRRIELSGTNHYPKEDLENLLIELRGNKNGRPGGSAKTTRNIEAFKRNRNKVLQGQMPIDEELLDDDDSEESIPQTTDIQSVVASLELPENATPKQMVNALQKHIASLIVKYNVIETLITDLSDPDWKARQAAANSLLGMVVPKIKSTEVVHSDSEEKKDQKERAIKLYEEIKEQIRQSKRPALYADVKVLEIESQSDNEDSI